VAKVDSRAKDLELITREAVFFVFNLFDDLTGGAMKRGWRDMTKPELVMEWDTLTPEQFDILREKKGDEWLAARGAEIEKIRRELDGLQQVNTDVPLQP
jgi:hypothetical protein